MDPAWTLVDIEPILAAFPVNRDAFFASGGVGGGLTYMGGSSMSSPAEGGSGERNEGGVAAALAGRWTGRVRDTPVIMLSATERMIGVVHDDHRWILVRLFAADNFLRKCSD